MKLPLMLATIAIFVAVAADRVGPPGAYPPAFVIGATDPKVTQDNIHQTICVAGYTSTVRAVTASTKAAVLQRDGQTVAGCCEVDHFLSLEIGGSNDAHLNLWAQPYAGEYGARKKDVVETALHRLVCQGKMTLIDAQHCITKDWIACGRKIGVLPKGR